MSITAAALAQDPMAQVAFAPIFLTMNFKQLLVASCAVVLGCQLSAPAQSKFQLTFTGTCSSTDDAGRIGSTPINNRTLLKKYADAHGITDLSTLGLAYHVHGSDLGDTIDVINRSDGATLDTVFGLYFGEDFGRMALRSGSGRQLRRLEYVYTDQNSHSLGSVLLTNYYVLDDNGNTNMTYVLGQMQYIVLPDATHTNVQICTANFTTVRPWQFSH